MFRVLHISDFHLNQSTLKDWNLYLKKPLIDKLKELSTKTNIDIVAFTGDILDKGGKDFENDNEGFSTAKAQIFDPILESLDIGIDRFFMVPGNHDIQRNKDSERDELGIQAYFEKDPSNIRKFINEKNDDGIKRIGSFKQFESDLYEGIKAKKIGKFSSSFIINIDNKDVGIACLNSAWRCYDNNDHGRVIIGTDVLSEHTQHLGKCDLKIALTHHPIDSLSDLERDTISSHLSKDFDLMLFGHSHRTITTITTGFTVPFSLIWHPRV